MIHRSSWLSKSELYGKSFTRGWTTFSALNPIRELQPLSLSCVAPQQPFSFQGHDQQQQNDSCPCQMSSCTQIQIVAAANLAVTQETTLLLVTIKSTPAALPLMHILHSTILESPTPPPRGM